MGVGLRIKLGLVRFLVGMYIESLANETTLITLSHQGLEKSRYILYQNNWVRIVDKPGREFSRRCRLDPTATRKKCMREGNLRLSELERHASYRREGE